MNPEKKLRKENNEKGKQLTKENNKILTDMVVYLHSGNLCEYDIEIMRRELLGMALEAQARNDSFENTIGSDHKAFCDELMKNGRKKTKYEKALETSSILVFGVGVLVLYEIVLNMIVTVIKFGLNSLSFEIPVAWGFIITTVFCVIAAYVFVHIISKHSFSMNLQRYQVLFGFAFAVFFAGFTFIKITMNKMILFSVNFLYLALPIVFLFVLINLMETKHATYLARTHK